MKNLSEKTKTARNISMILLAALIVFWFGFALLSGSEEYGGGLKGILMNSPNALPWLLLFVFLWVTWKWEPVGGIVIVFLGVVSIFFFDAFESPFVLAAISIPLMIFGGVFIADHYLSKRKQ